MKTSNQAVNAQHNLLETLFSEQQHVSSSQHEALKTLLQEGVPTRRTERWKYTPLRKAIHPDLKLLKSDLNQLARHTVIDELLSSEASVELVQIVNGLLHGSFSDKNVLIQNSDETLESQATHTDHFIANLNLAFLRSNLQLQVTGKVDPLLVLHLHASNDNDLNAYQLTIDADDHCTAKFLIIQTSSGEANTQVPVINIDAGQNSNLDLIFVQDLGAKSSQLAQTNIQMQRDATVNMQQIELGGDLIRHNIIADALDKGAEFHLGSLYLQNERQHVDTHLDMYHHAALTESTMLTKGILDQRARCIFNGKIYVEENAQLINANLNNNTLLLSQHAEINSKPELEIYADDVKCAHGATVGQLDEEAVFYLRARGIAEDDARSMLTKAFAREVYAGKVPKAVSEYLDSRLGSINQS